MALIKFNAVNVAYNPKIKINLQNISFSANHNDVVCIIGKSGTGKTTLLNSILHKEMVVSGNIIFLDQDLKTLNKKTWKKTVRKIGYLSQTVNSFEDDTVYLTIKRDLMNQQVWWKKILFYLDYQQRLNIFQTLDKLGIIEHAFASINQLSQGQKQRVEISKLLLKKPHLILADEPTSALDQVTAELTIDLIKQLQKIHSCCILINIHDLNLLKKISNKTLAIKNGKILFYKKTKDVTKEDLDLVY
ncbi:ABC transporter, ATP-binding protein [[Mycoplasma] cavipharyngis]|uniref:ATP-binding cassette domain-containing protein n=1 Tax=[Mycoplasma] cavipharyngis TaxID=92757 RepID=UPI0037038202